MLTVSRYSNGSNRLRCLTLIFASGVMTAGHRSRSKVWVSVSKGDIAVSLTSIFEISSLTFYDNDRLYSKSVKHRARCLSVSTVS